MDSPSPTPSPELVSQNVNCQICGKSVRGLPINGDCPNCKTPVALSVVQQLAPIAPSISVAGDVLVPEDRLCVKCRHNLRNLPEEGFCPECRTRIRESAPVAIMPGHKVMDDRPCLTCGYNLRGIETAGNCPECGTPAARSLRGFLLRYSSPEYIASLHRGALMVEASLVLLVVVSVGAYVTNIVFLTVGMSANPVGPAAPGGPMPAPVGAGLHGIVEAAIGLVFLLFGVSNLWGWWMISSPDPALTTEDAGDKSRRLMRTSLAISAAITVVSLIFASIPNLNTNLMAGAPNWPFPITPALLVGLAGCVVWMVGFVASMTYMAHQARRLPDASLNVKAKKYRWMLPVVSVVGLLACWLGPLVAFILYIGFINDWRRRLKTLNQSIMQNDLGLASTS